jgi:hypothetical protein
MGVSQVRRVWREEARDEGAHPDESSQVKSHPDVSTSCAREGSIARRASVPRR